MASSRQNCSSSPEKSRALYENAFSDLSKGKSNIKGALMQSVRYDCFSYTSPRSLLRLTDYFSYFWSRSLQNSETM